MAVHERRVRRIKSPSHECLSPQLEQLEPRLLLDVASPAWDNLEVLDLNQPMFESTDTEVDGGGMELERTAALTDGPAAAAISLPPIVSTKAAYCYQGGGGDDNYGSEWMIKAGSSDQYTTSDYVSYVEFNLSSIPAGATIDSASLDLYVDRTNGSGFSVRTYACAGSWSENSITWDDRPLSLYTTGGSSAWRVSTYVNGSGWESWNVKEAVQRWMDGRWSNHGFFLRADQWDLGSNHWFKSDDTQHAHLRPRLLVDYSLPEPDPDLYSISGIPSSVIADVPDFG